MGQAIAIVDADEFYVSCERVFDARLRGRPVVVLSNNDGCIISRSREAKALGIGMGVPLFKVRNIVEENGVAVFSSNYALYGDLSLARKRKAVKTLTYLWTVVSFFATTVIGVLAKEISHYLLRALWNFPMRVFLLN